MNGRATLAVTLLALFAGCSGKVVDPLARDRAVLLATAREPAPPGFAPDATLLLSAELLRSLLESSLSRFGDPSGALRIRLPLGVEAALQPRAFVESITVGPVDGCPGCVVVSPTVRGKLSTMMTRSPVSPLAPIAFRATLSAVFDMALLATVDGRRELRATPRDGRWRAQVEIEGASGVWSAALSNLVVAGVRGLLEHAEAPMLSLADLPADGPVRVRGLRARAIPGAIAVDFSFATLERGRGVAPPDAPVTGWAAVASSEALLAVARAAALRAGPVDGFAIEPVRLALRSDGFLLGLRIWHLAAKPELREVEIEGTLGLDGDGHPKLEPRAVRRERVPVDGGRFMADPIALLERSAVLEDLQKSLDVVIPVEARGSVGGQAVVVRPRALGADAEALRLFGDVAPLDAPARGRLEPTRVPR